MNIMDTKAVTATIGFNELNALLDRVRELEDEIRRLQWSAEHGDHDRDYFVKAIKEAADALPEVRREKQQAQQREFDEQMQKSRTRG